MAWWMIVAVLAGGTAAQREMTPMSGMQAPAAPCPATPAPLPADLAGWATMTPLTASPGPKPTAMLSIGTGARVTLLPAAAVTYAATMKHPGTPGSFGGNLVFIVASAGRYRVALGSGAWIDVVQGTTARPSTNHGKGPACTGVRKMVDFDLTPGTYTLQIAGNDAAMLGVMVAKLPG